MHKLFSALAALGLVSCATAQAIEAAHSKELDYYAVAGLPCRNLLKVYRTKRFSSLSDPVTGYIAGRISNLEARLI